MKRNENVGNQFLDQKLALSNIYLNNFWLKFGPKLVPWDPKNIFNNVVAQRYLGLGLSFEGTQLSNL